MAVVASLKKLEEQLTCAVCLDIFTDPKLLLCLHVHCRDCLKRLVVRDQQGQLAVNCPTCRKATPVPDNAVAGLQSAFHINHLLEIYDSLKAVQVPVTREEGMGGGKDDGGGAATPASKKVSLCSEHVDQELQLYCESCSELICIQCTIRSHHGHRYDLVGVAFEKHKEEMAQLLVPVEEQLGAVNSSLARLDLHCKEIAVQAEAVGLDMEEKIEALRRLLDQRRSEMREKIHRVTQWKLKSLAAQRDQIETTHAQLGNCIELVKGSLESGCAADMLGIKSHMTEQVRELTAAFQPNILEPVMRADMAFLTPADVTPVLNEYGTLVASKVEIYATGLGLEQAKTGEESTVVLHANDGVGELFSYALESLECELASELTPETVKGTLREIKDNECVISYRPKVKGWHRLNIKVARQDVKGGPFSVMVKLPVTQLGTLVRVFEGVQSCYGLALNKTEGLVVTRRLGGHVSIFSRQGQKMRVLGGHSSGLGKLRSPGGVVVDHEENILVVDEDNHHIQKFPASSGLPTVVGNRGCGPLQFRNPQGIAFNPTNRKVYVTDQNHCVQVLNCNLTFSSFFGGGPGSKEGQFNYPMGLACNSTGNVYVTDSANNRVQVFTAAGLFLSVLGLPTAGWEGLKRPMSVAVDSSDVVYVGESEACRVSVFNPRGVFVTSFGGRGVEVGKFASVNGLAVDSCGVLYVADMNSRRILVY